MGKFTASGKTKTVKASIVAPENAGLRMILNVCNMAGTFEAPLDAILTKRWGNVRQGFKRWHAEQRDFKIGCLNTVAIGSDLWVVSLLAEDKDGKLNTSALEAGIKKLAHYAKYEGGSLHVSTHLTDKFADLKDLLLKNLVEEGINVYFYEEPKT